MGQTLTNGIFLPNEGERNCYEGLAANWRALDYLIGGYNVHVADAVIHVSQEDRNKWDAVTNKADASALTAHTGDTTIHVTAEDKTAWNGKANDTDAVHKSGAETIGGLKTFTDLLTIDGDYLGTETSTNQRTNLQLRSNRDTAGQSAAFITRFRQNRVQGGMQPADVQKIGFDIMENETRTNNVFDIQCTGWVGDVPTRINFVSSASKYSFGRSILPCYINDLSPGALSLPDLTAGVDISGYITAGNNHSTYTPSVDGWISVALKSTSGACALWIYQNDLFNGYYGNTTRPGETEPFAATCLPVKANTVVNIDTKGVNSYVYAAKFYPCTGNV